MYYFALPLGPVDRRLQSPALVGRGRGVGLCYRTRVVTASAVLAAVSTLVSPVSALAQFTPQPAGRHSYLFDKNGKTLADDEFAMLMRQHLLTANGASKVKDAKFLFQQCFGGGMLDDLKSSLASVSWIGASAARWDQCSYADTQASLDSWTKALLPQLNSTGNSSLSTQIDIAARNDEGAKKGRFPEVPQKIGNNGANITLKDPAANSHHAIIWRGSSGNSDAERIRYDNNVGGVTRALTRQWGPIGPKVTVQTVATKDELIAALNGLALDTTEEFFFYATDHGSNVAVVQQDKPVRKGTNDVGLLNLFADELYAMRKEANNVPMLQLSYSGLTAPVAVLFNQILLGHLDPARSAMAFAIPESSISRVNSIEVFNNTAADFLIENESFIGGSIGTIPIVPEPSVTLLLATGLAGLLGYRVGRRRPKGKRPVFP